MEVVAPETFETMVLMREDPVPPLGGISTSEATVMAPFDPMNHRRRTFEIVLRMHLLLEIFLVLESLLGGRHSDHPFGTDLLRFGKAAKGDARGAILAPLPLEVDAHRNSIVKDPLVPWVQLLDQAEAILETHPWGLAVAIMVARRGMYREKVPARMSKRI